MGGLLINIEPAVSNMAEEFKLRVTRGQFNKALARALNRTIERARTTAYREIRKEYNIPAKNLRNDMSIVRANPTMLSAKLNALGKPLPIAVYQARQTKKGVTANIAKRRVLIKGAFFATMPNGHRGVFARGHYVGKKFDFRKERIKDFPANDLEINELFSKSVPSAIMNGTVLASIKTNIQRELQPRLRHELTNILRSTGR